MRENEGILYHELHSSSPDFEWILFIHGAGGSTVTWKRQVPELKKKFNLLLIDLPGHGRMAKKPNADLTYTWALIARKIKNVIDHLSIKKFHIIGVSVGTVIALQMRQMFLDQVKSVIMPGCIIQLNPKLKLIANSSLMMAKIIGFRAFYKMSALVMMPRKNHKVSRDVFIRESKALSINEFRKWTNMYYTLNETLVELFKASSSIPQLVVMGAQDHLFLQPAKAYAEKHINTSIKIIEKCGHVVSIEKASIFNSMCLEFYKNNSFTK